MGSTRQGVLSAAQITSQSALAGRRRKPSPTGQKKERLISDKISLLWVNEMRDLHQPTPEACVALDKWTSRLT
jgi:hypothetical protein